MVIIAWRKATLGRVHAGTTITIQVSATELIFECDDSFRTVRRTNDRPDTRIKAHRPRRRQAHTVAETP
ncbi:hypothetical protein KZZ52_36090 [Dactylosporangium sp. AC04546]|uniref:hypothetical protein n=1 Tax=Dactylosporangium sp. AC04546 TaxID=2862460 RepID=UPI001EE0C98B|nr:hypothetical protein [Dactylosporangium sp. AC04546]WVK79389.1 hypothetical protein KZZ52_36090 [Dactylosporangium sp. AC04546]